MPTHCSLVKGRWRVCDPDGKLTKKDGLPVDGGGHINKEKCVQQSRAINISMGYGKDRG